MNDAVAAMLAKYECDTLEDCLAALREILQEIALLGLWRSRFFDKAAFYGGTALRVLHGLDRFSEDLDFSLLAPADPFSLAKYTDSLQKELDGFGFNVSVDTPEKARQTNIQSAFLKADTFSQLLVIETAEEVAKKVHRGQILKIKIEVDTDPPAGFETRIHYLLQPIPFAVRVYTLPDLLAGKMHAILCRHWKTRAKGRDWYDLVWYAAHHPELHLAHLEQRMRQTGHWKESGPLSQDAFMKLLIGRINTLDVDQAKREVEPFVRHPDTLALWSRDFFLDVVSRIRSV